MSILRVFAIAAAGLIASCAEVPIAKLDPPVAQEVTVASVPASPVETEDGDVTLAARGVEVSTPEFPLATPQLSVTTSTPTPLTQAGQPVTWWFVFKFNAKSFPSCGPTTVKRSCPFGGVVQPYKQFSQQYVYASDTQPTLARGENMMPKRTAAAIAVLSLAALAGGPLLATRRCTRRSVRVRLPGLLPPALELSPASTESRSRYCCGIPQA